MKKHLAIVASIGAGKTTVADYFVGKGFELYRLSYAIMDEARKRGLDTGDRITLQDLGDEMRAKMGVDVLAQIAVKKFNEEKAAHYVIDSIRNHNELKRLKEAFSDDLLILAIDAPIELRYQRVVDRKGQYKEQKTTFEQFKKIDKRDLGVGNAENEQNVQKCINMADITINNAGTLKELHKKLEKIYLENFSLN